MGRFVLAPEGLHPGLHDRARIHGENKATVRQEKCKDHRLIGGFHGRSRRMGEGHRGNSGSRAKLPDHRGCRFQRRKTLWDAPRRYEGDAKSRKPADNATVRNVYVVGPDKKIKLILVYPMTTGRNFDEVLRVIDSLQLTAKHQVATPVNWLPGEDVIIAGSVSDEEAKKRYPQGWKAPKPYLRIVPQPQ